MKILITQYELNNLAGIINNTENLIAGFMELGHEVDMVQLVWKDSSSGKRTRFPERFEDGVLYRINQESGWLWPDGKRIPYKGWDNINTWYDYAHQFDLVLWTIPVPTKQKSNQGNGDWPYLYDLDKDVKQIVYVHDAHFQRAYPHLWCIIDFLDGIATTNLAGYHHTLLDVPKAQIFSPHKVPDEPKYRPYNSRVKGFLAPQTFKSWKHVDDLIRAIPHLGDDIEYRLVAGDGIERRYMTSPDKCKAKYYYENGNRIWDVAVDHGMEWLNWIHPTDRDYILGRIRTLVDPSYSKSFAKWGDHFNRVATDAILAGAIPVCRNLGVSTNEDGNGELFKAGKNYIMVPWDSTSEEFAEILTYANNLDPMYAMELQEEGWKILQHFDRRTVAQQFIDLSEGKPTGFYGELVREKTPIDVQEKACEMLEDFFEFEG